MKKDDSELKESAKSLLMKLLGQFEQSQVVYVAKKSGLADCLKDDTKTLNELSVELSVNEYMLELLLDALEGLNIVAKVESGGYCLTTLGEGLRSDVPDSISDSLLSFYNEVYLSWGFLHSMMKKGKNAFEQAHGMPFWEFVRSRPEMQSQFDKLMTETIGFAADSLLKSYDFSLYEKIMDIGGGHGLLLSTILEKYPHLRGVLFDQPQVLEGVEKNLNNNEQMKRIEMKKGDFFKSIPKGCDLYILTRVIHDWDDEYALSILKNCKKAMSKGSKLLVIDRVYQVEKRSLEQSIGSLEMKLLSGGQERNYNEFNLLLQKSGFDIERVIDTNSHLSVIEAVCL